MEPGILGRAFLQGYWTVQAGISTPLLAPVQPGYFAVELPLKRMVFSFFSRRSSRSVSLIQYLPASLELLEFIVSRV